jgi:hypothetical protein
LDTFVQKSEETADRISQKENEVEELEDSLLEGESWLLAPTSKFVLLEIQ